MNRKDGLPKRSGRRASDEIADRNARWADDYRSGMRKADIAERDGMAITTVNLVLRKLGITIRDRPKNPDRLPPSPAQLAQCAAQKASRAARNDQWEADYRSGLTLEQIGQAHGVTRERVRQVLARRGLTAADGGCRHPDSAISKHRAARRVDRDAEASATAERVKKNRQDRFERTGMVTGVYYNTSFKLYVCRDKSGKYIRNSYFKTAAEANAFRAEWERNNPK